MRLCRSSYCNVFFHFAIAMSQTFRHGEDAIGLKDAFKEIVSSSLNNMCVLSN